MTAAGRPLDLTLANWREAPGSRWSFRHVRELLPTAAIGSAAEGEPAEAATGARHADLMDLPCPLPDGSAGTLEEFLSASRTDELLVLRHGAPAFHWTAPGSEAGRPHLLFSVSKSLTGLLCGILIDRGRLDADEPVARYVPELSGSAYADAAVRDLLDMTVSLDFREDYLDADGAFARYRRATLWNPSVPGADPGDLLGFLAGLGKGSDPHGARFFYASPNSDTLGLVAERAGGAPYAALMGEFLFAPAGARGPADVTLDRRGTARAAGGVSATARDLARLGDLLRQGGAGIVPEAFVADLWTGGRREAWLAAAEPSVTMPDARYRSQWYALGGPDDALCAIGIHGQWIHVHPARGTVIVRLSSQVLPVDDAIDGASLAAFDAISATL